MNDSRSQKSSANSKSTSKNRPLDLIDRQQTRDLERTEAARRQLQGELRQLGKEKSTLLKDISLAKKRLNTTLKEQQDKIDAKRFELRSLEKEIEDRKKYLKDQEQLIADKTEDGNQRLLSIKYEIEDGERIKQEIANDTLDSQNDLKAIREQKAVAEQELADFEQGYKEVKKEKLDELLHIEEAIREAKLK